MELSLEEKEAIKILKQEPDFSLSYYKRERAIDIVLNLIEKQQKEISRLQKNYISKDKIREKIKEYNVPIFDILDKLPIMPKTIERGCGAKDGIIYVLHELLEDK